MDKLLEAAEFYKENLSGRKFHLIAGKSGNKIEFDISFSAENFKHLAGLHKLIDVPVMQRGGEIIYRQILSGQTTIADINKSEHYEDVELRLNSFNALKETLTAKKLMIKSSHGYFNSIRADFMLTKQNDDFGYAHLFLKGIGDNFTVPVTFIIQSDNSYLKNNPEKWTVISIEEIKKAEKETQKSSAQQTTQKKTKK